jgi:predicted  nucleic acid-binding Zn-ribbon protein
MGYWERVKKDLQVAMKEGADLLKEGTTTMTTEARRVAKKGAASMKEEAARVTRIGKLRYQVYRLNQKAQAKFTEIGGQVYDLTSKDLKELKMNEKLQKLIQETKEIEGQVKTLEAEVLKLSKKKGQEAA